MPKLHPNRPLSIAPSQSSPLNRPVAVFVYDGLCTFEFGIADEIFGLERPEMRADWYRFLPCAERPGTYRTNSGVQVSVTAGLEALAEAGTIVIPGWRTDGIATSTLLARTLREAVERGARLLAICSGVFLPAAYGLLSGRLVTTHWRHVARLAALHPDVSIDPGVLYVDHGDIATSAGTAARCGPSAAGTPVDHCRSCASGGDERAQFRSPVHEILPVPARGIGWSHCGWIWRVICWSATVRRLRRSLALPDLPVRRPCDAISGTELG